MANRIRIQDYTVDWRSQFTVIKQQLISDLVRGDAPFLNIEHVGSTSVNGLSTKPIIDILIVIDSRYFNDVHRIRYEDALAPLGGREGQVFRSHWAPLTCHQGYICHGDGGVEGRWSFKLEGVLPRRNLYIASHGGHYEDSVISLRNTLTENPDLRCDYDRIKRFSSWHDGPKILWHCQECHYPSHITNWRLVRHRS